MCCLLLDVPNAFCQTGVPSLDPDRDRTIMKIEGPMVLLLQPDNRSSKQCI